MKLLNECSDELEGGKEKGQVTGLPELRNMTVQAMSNLLSANIDSGLMHSISKSTIYWNSTQDWFWRKLAFSLLICFKVLFFWPGLGYHKDPQTRAAFMEVLTKILQQGTEFETLAETALADRYDRLVELVTMIGDKGELPIAMALANVVDNQHLVCNLPHQRHHNRSMSKQAPVNSRGNIVVPLSNTRNIPLLRHQDTNPPSRDWSRVAYHPK